MMSTPPSLTIVRDIYTKMLLARIIDNNICYLRAQGSIQAVASCRGYEAAQVASAACIEVENDFTLPHYRDLGVVLTIGMTPYEVFRTSLQAQRQHELTVQHKHTSQDENNTPFVHHWGYHKHNTITGPVPVATQLLHAAGIAFACKLRKASAVAVAYCGDEAVTEPDFLESLCFAAQHKLPAIFICEQDCGDDRPDPSSLASCTQSIELPTDCFHLRVDGSDAIAVYSAMQEALQRARAGYGPTLLEMHIIRPRSYLQEKSVEYSKGQMSTVHLPAHASDHYDPLVRCQHYLEEHNAWDETWATQLAFHIEAEVERALQDALRDTLQPTY